VIHVCDIRELPTLAELDAWAAEHGVRIGYLGADLENRPVYGATRGHLTRLARDAGPDLHRHPLVWRSPLESTETLP
jgi:hypothetical protein